MLGNVRAVRLVGDLGGGTQRIANVAFIPGRRPQVDFIHKQEVKFLTGNELMESFLSTYKKLNLDGQNHSAISLGAPVDEDRGVILKMTNHDEIVMRDIPLGKELSRCLSEYLKRKFEVKLKNDGGAGNWAEFNEGGALEKLQPGELGMALIIGNGVGGRLYTRTASGDLVEVPGGFEPGHAPVEFSLLARLGLLQLLPKKMECGCKTVGIKGKIPFCFESVAKGPTLEAMAREYLSTIWVSSLIACFTQGSFPALFVTKDAYRSSVLIRSIALQAGMLLESPGDLFAASYSNISMTRALRQDPNDFLATQFLSRIGMLYASRLESIQRGQDKTGSITFALIGGIGVNWGPGLAPQIEAGIRSMHADPRQVPAWAHASRVVTGAFPADETNLIGDAYYLLHLEQVSVSA